MLRLIQSFIVCLFCLVGAMSFAGLPVDGSIAPMLKRVMPAVVNIKCVIKVTDFNTLLELQKQRAKKSDDTDDELPTTFTSVGSGVIIDPTHGYIITNAHVINDAQTITVTLGDGRHFTAKTIGTDKPSDVALLQIEAKGLTGIQLANSNDLKVGDFVAAIGNPFGLSQTVTSGIVSALGRTTLGIENYENFIQTDAPINPGNSGGALINMQGQLIGINTAILAPDRGSVGIGFAIPANMAKSVTAQLLAFGNVKRGTLGIGAQDITPELAAAFNMPTTQGAAITQVLQHSPAQEGGLQVGDIITSVNGVAVKSASDVVNTVGFLRVNSKITLVLLRHGKAITASVILSDPGKRLEANEHTDPFFFGVAMKNFTITSPTHGNVQGVLVVSVEQASKAWQSDLRPGDVITSVNQQTVSTIEQLRRQTNTASKTVLLNILRGSGAMFLVIDKA